MSIFFNNSSINDWNFGDDNIIKVYRNGAVVFYKFDSEQGGYKVCFAVVDDITQYTDTEFEDVFNKADGKWYKLNNLNQYEQYGVYGSGRTITYYDGKLTIDDGYEYQYSGNSWVNVGEVSGSSKSSDFKVGDIKERVTTGVSDGDYLLFSYYNKSDISKPENIMSYNPSNNYLSNLSGYGITSIDSTTIIDPSIWTVESTASANTFYIKSIKNNLYWGYQSRVSTRSLNLVDSSSSQKTPVLITPSCKENCYGFVEKKSNASTGYGGYGLNQLNGYTYRLNWWNNGSSNVPCTFFATDGNADFIIYKMNANDVEYPKYYDEIQDPPDNLVFTSMVEAEAYECPWVGMTAIIDNTDYLFCESNEWLTKYAYQEVSGEYLCDSGNKYKKMQEYDRLVDGTMSATTNYVIGDLIESGSPDCAPQFISLQDLASTYPTQSISYAYRFTNYSDVSGITYFRIHPSKATTQGSYVFADHNADNATGTTKFAIKSDANGSLYRNVGGYSTLKAAADASSCAWAYWVDADTIEVDVVTAVGTTIFIKQWQTYFVTDYIEYKFA